MRVGFGEDEYNAGMDYCPDCGRGRRFLLRVRSFRIEVGPWHWHLFRRYRRICTRCQYVEVLREPPVDWLDHLPGEQGDTPGSAAGAAAPDPAELPAGASAPAPKLQLTRPDPEGSAEEGAGAAVDGLAGPWTDPGEHFSQLAARMDYLLAPVGSRERQHLVTTATPGVGGIFLEHARREASALLRQAMALREAARLDPQALERALEEAVFAAAWEGYTAFAVLARLRGGGPPRTPDLSLDEFMRRVAPLAYKRAERGRAGTPAELTAWFWQRRGVVDQRLREASLTLPPRMRPSLERAARDAMHLGYAVAAEEGRFGPG